VYMVTMRLERGLSPPWAGVAEIAAALRDCARPDDRLEHVFAQWTERGMDAVLFLVAPGPEQAAATAYALCLRAKPAMPGYLLVSCEVSVPPAPVGQWP
jgi:hypothetical protein